MAVKVAQPHIAPRQKIEYSNDETFDRLYKMYGMYLDNDMMTVSKLMQLSQRVQYMPDVQLFSPSAQQWIKNVINFERRGFHNLPLETKLNKGAVYEDE